MDFLENRTVKYFIVIFSVEGANEAVIKRKDGIVERKIHDSFYLINVKQNYLDDNCFIYEINEVGSYIWNHIDKNNSIHSIAESIRTTMNIQDISFNDIKRDISEYINVLVEEGFLEVLDEKC